MRLVAPYEVGALTQGRVLDEALKLVDEEGLEALTMRRLGKRLGVEAVSLYNHVDGKPALRAGIVRLLWRRLSIRSKTATAGSTLCAPSRDASAASRRSIRTRRSRRSPSRRPTAGEGADELESLVTFVRAFPPDTPPELVRVAGDTCMCDADDEVEYGSRRCSQASTRDATPTVTDPLLVETVVLDGMWRVADDDPSRGRRYRISWFDPPFRPPHDETTQALAIGFTSEQQIVLVSWDGEHWTLPGGSPEPGETLEQTLAREVREEACARVLSCSYIGCQRVEELDGDRLAYYQTRFWARVELDEFRADHEMIARRLVVPDEFPATLFWGAEATAELILERGLAIETGTHRL